MKKLMIAAVAVAAAAFAQAATVNWQSGVMYAAVDAKGTTGTSVKYGSSGHKGTAYLFYFDTLDAYNLAKASDVADLYADYILDAEKVKTAKATKTPTAGGAANIALTGQPDGSAVSPVQLYGMEIFVDTDTAKSYDDVDAFVKVGFADGSYADAAGTTFYNMGTQQTNWTAIESVPEPFSGTLALLGMGAIALRRKMKKAKKA